MDEFERKALIGEREYREIESEFAEKFKTHIQVNYYYDTPDSFFGERGVTVRIRLTENGLCGTVKSHGAKGEFYSNEEDFSVERLPAEIVIKDKRLSLAGELITERKTADLGGGFLLMLDKSFYLGTVDYEIELEYPGESSDKAKEIFESVIKAAGAQKCEKPALGKAGRFFKAARQLEKTKALRI